MDYRHKARRSTGDFQNTIRQAAQLTKLDSPVTLASYRAFPSAEGYSKPRSHKTNEPLAFRMEEPDAGGELSGLRKATESLDYLRQPQMRC